MNSLKVRLDFVDCSENEVIIDNMNLRLDDESLIKYAISYIGEELKLRYININNSCIYKIGDNYQLLPTSDKILIPHGISGGIKHVFKNPIKEVYNVRLNIRIPKPDDNIKVIHMSVKIDNGLSNSKDLYKEYDEKNLVSDDLGDLLLVQLRKVFYECGLSEYTNLFRIHADISGLHIDELVKRYLSNLTISDLITVEYNLK